MSYLGMHNSSWYTLQTSDKNSHRWKSTILMKPFYSLCVVRNFLMFYSVKIEVCIYVFARI